MPAAAIETRALRKVYPAPSGKRRGKPRAGPPGMPPGPPMPTGEVVALQALDLDINEGEFFGLLGPNGAGKTTTIGILTTRVVATAGTARVSGVDVATDAVRVRTHIGVVPQRPNPDRSLNALENLIYHAAYFGIPRSVAEQRARELMTRLDIADKTQAKVDQLSGGQQQRLMIARALIHEPDVLFLDEPTVGLDPQARLDLWAILRDLHNQGRTIVMTTHYMEEADRLCDRIGIVDRGKLLALDTPARLKERAPGGTLIELQLDADAQPLVAAVTGLEGVLRAEAQGTVLRAFSERGGRIISPLIQLVEDGGLHVRNIGLTEPSLETLFVSLTGRKLD
ncbi:MAG TPA: ABC transporter ATP-binding protein [Gemmatimonadaceae bacterium]|nr:ABC transporter ATP-binding protein [Gemmatimonadaceae bacterium]